MEFEFGDLFGEQIKLYLRKNCRLFKHLFLVYILIRQQCLQFEISFKSDLLLDTNKIKSNSLR